jgi:hypothetical protein
LVGLFGWRTRQQGLYLHRTAQHRKIKTNMQALNGIRTPGLSVQAYASNLSPTDIGYCGPVS